MPKKKKATARPSVASKPRRAASPKRKTARARPRAGTKAKRRVGLPAPEDVVSEETLHAPTGKVYRILKTNERDEYDQTGKTT